MTVRARSEDVRRYIVEQVDDHPTDISKITAEHFGITRQAVNKHLQKLRSEGELTETGNTRNREWQHAFVKSHHAWLRILSGEKT